MNINKQELSYIAVPGYETFYIIAPDGTIRSLHTRSRGGTIVARIDRAGYMTVRLSKNGRTFTHYLHRLLGAAFIPNPRLLPVIDHISGDKLDNRLENLAWVDHRENITRAYRAGLIKRKYCRIVVDESTGEKFGSIREAADCFGIPYSSCKNYLNGRRRNPTSLRWAA